MTKLTRWMAVFDTHGDKIDHDWWKAAREFAKQWKPKIRVAGGDHYDIRWLRNDASLEEQRSRIDDDLDTGKAFLESYNPTHICWGNHEYRVFDAMRSSDGKVANHTRLIYKDYLKPFEDAATKAVPYHNQKGVIRIGKLAFVHGYGEGRDTLRDHMRAYMSPVVMGHVHRVDVITSEGTTRLQSFSSGCGCLLDMGYNVKKLGSLRQSQGWVYGVTDDRGNYAAWNAQKVGDKWIMPSEMR